MKSLSSIKVGALAAFFTGLLAITLVGLAPRSVRADVWDKKTTLTVDQPIQVEDTYLEPGTYVFKLLNSSSDRHIVQIYNEDQNHLINTIMAIPNYQVTPSSKSRFTFYETPPGTARAMHAWFYPGDNFGQEFRYPKQLRQIAAVTPALETRPQAPPPPPPAASAPVEPEPAPVAAAPPPPPSEPAPKEPVVVAQATPPPAPQTQDAAPAPPPQAPEPPSELPKTATPFPLIGAGGAASLAAFSLLRLFRSISS